MNAAYRSIVVSGLLGAALAGVTLLAGCRSASGTYNPGTGQLDIRIEGDDGVVISAAGYENALNKAIQAKKDAEARGDAAAAADWGRIIDKILEKKGKPWDNKSKTSLQNTGTLTETVAAATPEDGELGEPDVTYAWEWNGLPEPTEEPEPTPEPSPEPPPAPGEGDTATAP